MPHLDLGQNRYLPKLNKVGQNEIHNQKALCCRSSFILAFFAKMGQTFNFIKIPSTTLLIGGYGDVVTENRSRTNLSHVAIDETQDDVDSKSLLTSTPKPCLKISVSY